MEIGEIFFSSDELQKQIPHGNRTSGVGLGFLVSGFVFLWFVVGFGGARGNQPFAGIPRDDRPHHHDAESPIIPPIKKKRNVVQFPKRIFDTVSHHPKKTTVPQKITPAQPHHRR
ncbi:MAG: hypothetical protein JJU35_10410 [Balneolales bacterium]|nr:hypothetical protein [Balneolales bacterium]